MSSVSFISINTQFENLGDALINRELIRLLAQNSDVVVDSASAPDWFIDMLDLPVGAQRVSGKWALLKSVIKARLSGSAAYYFYMPGGSFGDFSVFQMLRKMLILLALMPLGLIGVRFCSVGMSFERLGPRFLSYLRLRNFNMHRFYVRDVESSRLLESSGVKHSGVLPDLAFNLFSRSPKPAEEIKHVCFSFRVDQHSTQFDDCYSFVEKVICELPATTHYHIAVQVERDLDGMRMMAEKLLVEHGLVVAITHEARNIDVMQQFYSGMNLIVSNRLHVLLLGASVTGRLLAYADSKNRKIEGLFSTVGRADLVLGGEDSGVEINRAINASPFEGGVSYKKLRLGVGDMF